VFSNNIIIYPPNNKILRPHPFDVLKPSLGIKRHPPGCLFITVIFIGNLIFGSISQIPKL